MGNSFPIEFVGNPDFNFIQHIQNVKFCQSNAAKQVTLSLDSCWTCISVTTMSHAVAQMLVQCSSIQQPQTPGRLPQQLKALTQ